MIRLFVILFLSACSSNLVLVKPAGEKLTPLETKKIIADIRFKSDSINTVKISSKTSFVHEEEKVVNKSIMIAKYPNQFRLQILAPNVAYTLADLVFNDPTTIFFDIENKVAYKDDTNKLFEENTGIPVSIKDFSKLMIGNLTSKQLSEVTNITKLSDSLFAIEGKDFYAKYDINLSGLTEYQFLDDDETIFLMYLNSYANIEGVSLPQRIDISLPEKESSIKIDFKSISINSQIKDYVLNPEIPEGFDIK